MRSCSARERSSRSKPSSLAASATYGARGRCAWSAPSALDRGRDVDPFPPEKQLARERRAVEVAQRERFHRTARYNLMVRRLLPVVLVLLLPGSAAAGDRELLEARDAYLSAAERSYSGDPDGLQARYDAGRDLVEAVRAAGPPSAGCLRLRDQLRALGLAQVRFAESFDGPVRSILAAAPARHRALHTRRIPL